MNKTKNESFCLRRCRSVEHADEIISAILRGNEEQAIAFMCWRCSNYGRVTDEAGRTALHVASSCGKTRVLEWILKNCDNKACLNSQDYESGYTPLHRCLFHGQLSSARCLIQHGAKLDVLDNEGLAPLDQIMRDGPEFPVYGPCYPCEVYVWGNNSNFNLGIGNHQIRRYPDSVDYFRKNNISIRMVAMGKFHSIFISQDGRAFSCGLGQGGRLGLDSEETVMTPNQISISPHQSVSRPTASKNVITFASVGQDHSILISEKGIVYTFGMNDYYQLGVSPPPPFQLSPKPLQLILEPPFGVSAAHYHSVAWSPSEIFTWGYNCGQLGYTTPNKYQITPKQVPHLRGVRIVSVAAGDSATVVATVRGEVYLLRAHSCIKIGSSLGVLERIEVSGGRLDPALIKSADVSGWGDYRTGEDDLTVLTVSIIKNINIWQSSTNQFCRCCFSVGNRYLTVADAALSSNKLLVVTNECEGFETELKINKKSEESNLASSSIEQTPLQKLVEKDTSIHFDMKRLGGVHRAISIYCDPKGCNYSVIQTHPALLTPKPETGDFMSLEKYLLILLEDATESDCISDVVFSIYGLRIPAHRYILECNSEKLASIIHSAEKAQSSSLVQNLKTEVNENDNPKCQNILTVKLENVHPVIFKEILKFVYTGVCDFSRPDYWSPEKDLAYVSFFNSNETFAQCSLLNHNPETVDEVAAKDKSFLKNLVFKGRSSSSDKTELEYNPVNDARKTAAYFGLNEMVKRLDGFAYKKSKCMVYRKAGCSEPLYYVYNMCLNPQNCPHLHDVVIECSEGKLISAHKCILLLRSKYFETMLKGNWLECSGRRNLSLPFPYEIVDTIILYLYQNKVPLLSKSEDLTFICQVLVAADHILLEGLRDICQVSLSNHVTLKNVTELFQFADTYNAYKLKRFCKEYICFNIRPLLESRALDGIDDDLMDDLQVQYWSTRPEVLYRCLAIPSKYPDLSILESIYENVGIPSEEEHFQQNEHLSKSSPKKEVIDVPKKNRSRKRHKSKKSSVDENAENLSRLSIASTSTSNCDLENSKGLDTSFCLNVAEDTESCEASLQVALQDDLEKDMSQFDLELKSKESLSTPVTYEKNSCNMESKGKIEGIPVIDLEFPSLTGDSQQFSLSASAKVPKQRMAKMSQKARKKLLATAGVVDEPNDSPQDALVPEVNVWKKMGNVSQEEILPSNIEAISLSDIMKEERMRCPRTRGTSQSELSSEEATLLSVPLSSGSMKNNSSKPNTAKSQWMSNQPIDECHDSGKRPFDEIMADELKQRQITKKIMGKSLSLTQIEEKAIKELQQHYTKDCEFDERITVKRHCSGQASKPVWITSKNP